MGAYAPMGFYRNKPRVKVDEDYCRGCLNCVSACPREGKVLRARKVGGEVRAKAEHPEPVSYTHLDVYKGQTCPCRPRTSASARP